MTEDAWQDDLYILQHRYPQLIFSHETSSFLLGFSSREPFEISVTLETGKSSTRLNKSGIKVYKIKKELFELGLIEGQTPTGHKVRMYNAERTVCDLIRNRSKIEIQEVQTVIQEYFRRQDKDIPQLMRYAKLLCVEKIIKQYTGVLL